MDSVFGLFGTGGFGREVMPVAREAAGSGRVVFVETVPSCRYVNGIEVLSEEEFFSLDCGEKRFNAAIGDSKARQRIAEACQAAGISPMSIQAPSATFYADNEIGEGAVFCAFTTVTSNARIGKFFQCNIYSYVAHDCVIGDFVTFAPRVNCNGNIRIGDHAYIGTGAIIRQGTKSSPLMIGENAIVGMGAVVLRDVPPNTTVVGNPARELVSGRK